MERRVILIVDDEERVLFVLQNALMKLEEEFDVVTAHTADDALRKIGERKPDLVITDMIMPEMDGIELTEKLREQGSRSSVVWMTAYGCASFESEAERLGVHRCVEKPVEIDEMRQVAREALDHADGRASRGR